MKLTQQNIRQAIISEYVLGTLSSRARRRFEHMLLSDAELQRQTDEMARKINLLAMYSKPVKPPGRIWRGIESRLNNNFIKPKGLFFWKFSSLFASLGAFVLLFMLLNTPSPQTQTTIISVISNDKAQSAWLMSSSEGFIKVRAIQEQNISDDKDFELWLIKDTQSAPISLGLLSKQGEVRIQLAPGLISQIKQAAAMAVSLEPKGGSPTGAPTGPVLYQGKIISL